MTAVAWFRRDLRLDDNPAWSAATREHDEVTALFVLDEGPLRWSSPLRTSALYGYLAALDAALQERGGRLRVERGRPVDVVPAVADGGPVYWNTDYSAYATARDRSVAGALTGGGSAFHGNVVHPPGSVRTAEGALYQVFTPFYRTWCGLELGSGATAGAASVRQDPGDGVPGGDPPPLETSAAAAASRLEEFLDRVDRYDEVRDRIDEDATSHLSIDLKFGAISARTVVARAVERHESAPFVRQLAWRDFHAHTLWEHPDLPHAALRPEYRAVEWADDGEALAAWKDGRTGYPLVDAAMRRLRETGRMHNRARMVVASFLVKDLGIDWREGERHFRRLLLDSDLAQNAGNWQWVAGTGRDAAPYFRIFNPVTQSQRFDPRGAFIRRWVPELADLDEKAIHAPWEHPDALCRAGITLGEDYPGPIVDHAEAREETLARYGVARGV